LAIGLSDGSQLELNDSSTLVLTENILRPDGSRASTKVTLLGGLVHALVRVSVGGAPNFGVYTPNAVASARGTTFDVAYSNQQPPPSGP
jgi:ferric-dicitrate binding protein FerR (iron transport regulator)